jgi:2-keto-myo-inositol isomerase
MIQKHRFALNRIACPSLPLADFFAFAAGLGISKVELRNDLRGGAVADGMPPSRAAALAKQHGVTVISINALQKFNLGALRLTNHTELEGLLELGSALGCGAIVLCPANDPQDRRDEPTRREETRAALEAFGPSFEKWKMQGWVEPLGFSVSSLSSVSAAREAIRLSGHDCYRILYDTFHHHIGPDTDREIDKAFAAGQAALIHVSGVEVQIPKESFRDSHRLLPSAEDRLRSGKQVARMVSLGYRGDISFEPFSVSVQKMDGKALAAALKASMAYLGSVTTS